jgi:hypothetical protein
MDARITQSRRVRRLRRLNRQVKREIKELEAMGMMLKFIVWYIKTTKTEDEMTDSEYANAELADNCCHFLGFERVKEIIDNRDWIVVKLRKKLAGLRLELEERNYEILRLEISAEMSRLWRLDDINGMNLLKRCFDKKKIFI